MEPHDLAVAKLCAGRDKDLEFVRARLGAAVIEPGVLLQRLSLVTAPAAVLDLAPQRLLTYSGAD